MASSITPKLYKAGTERIIGINIDKANVAQIALVPKIAADEKDRNTKGPWYLETKWAHHLDANKKHVSPVAVWIRGYNGKLGVPSPEELKQMFQAWKEAKTIDPSSKRPPPRALEGSLNLQCDPVANPANSSFFGPNLVNHIRNQLISMTTIRNGETKSDLEKMGWESSLCKPAIFGEHAMWCTINPLVNVKDAMVKDKGMLPNPKSRGKSSGRDWSSYTFEGMPAPAEKKKTYHSAFINYNREAVRVEDGTKPIIQDGITIYPEIEQGLCDERFTGAECTWDLLIVIDWILMKELKTKIHAMLHTARYRGGATTARKSIPVASDEDIAGAPRNSLLENKGLAAMDDGDDSKSVQPGASPQASGGPGSAPSASAPAPGAPTAKDEHGRSQKKRKMEHDP